MASSEATYIDCRVKINNGNKLKFFCFIVATGAYQFASGQNKKYYESTENHDHGCNATGLTNLNVGSWRQL